MINVSKSGLEKAARNAIFDQVSIPWHEQVLRKDEGQNCSQQEGKKKKSPTDDFKNTGKNELEVFSDKPDCNILGRMFSILGDC